MIGERELHIVQALRQGFREDERRTTPIVGHVRSDTPSHLSHGHRIRGGGTCVVGTVGRAGGEFGIPLSIDRIAATVFDQRGDLHTGGDGFDERSADAGSRSGRILTHGRFAGIEQALIGDRRGRAGGKRVVGHEPEGRVSL